jgi:hypothetical protein
MQNDAGLEGFENMKIAAGFGICDDVRHSTIRNGPSTAGGQN